MAFMLHWWRETNKQTYKSRTCKRLRKIILEYYSDEVEYFHIGCLVFFAHKQ